MSLWVRICIVIVNILDSIMHAFVCAPIDRTSRWRGAARRTALYATAWTCWTTGFVYIYSWLDYQLTARQNYYIGSNKSRAHSVIFSPFLLRIFRTRNLIFRDKYLLHILWHFSCVRNTRASNIYKSELKISTNLFKKNIYFINLNDIYHFYIIYNYYVS